MSEHKQIKSALISVYNKNGLDRIIDGLNKHHVTIYATGGTFNFITEKNIPVKAVEDITGYPSILGGRVKTLHPSVFGGILGRREVAEDLAQLAQYNIPEIDLVVVDLYPFESTVSSKASESDIIEKIDIGGISLIRGAAKNFRDVVIIPSFEDYEFLIEVLEKRNGATSYDERKRLATKAFAVSSHYDSAIYNYFNGEQQLNYLRSSFNQSSVLRYGENPHQHGVYYGNIEDVFEKLNGKELSYNNLLDCDAAVSLISDFTEPTVAIIKHNNACGLASRASLSDAWKEALAGDPVSAFGGVIVSNQVIDLETASEINKLFFEVLIAPGFNADALAILMEKKNRIILKQKTFQFPRQQFRSILNGVLHQDADRKTEIKNDLKIVTLATPSLNEMNDLIFANKIVKHSKSNAIVLAKDLQLIASGVGQTSRVDALNHAISKARNFEFELKGAVMASDAFFPFADCVEIAHQAGINSVIQPGGSIRDQDSIDYCNKNGMSMVITGTRHFKH